MAKKQDVVKRFWSKVDLSGDCWIWRGTVHHGGYGVFWLDSRSRLAHCVAYELTHGNIPDGLLVLHDCDNQLCVNPDHLHLGTHQDNMREMVERRRAATSARNGSRLYPEKLKRGDENGSRIYPERLPRGDAHHARLHPERVARGERITIAKLTAASVRQIRELYTSGAYTQTDLAQMFGVTHVTISAVVRRETWRHVE